ncbi:MAG: KTSC domain-containing protein [Verrucomicrobiota bacterium]|jgi:hypothetical protein|nr:KTSC domain-containing protein [Verrucomicrobiota bacterium]
MKIASFFAAALFLLVLGAAAAPVMYSVDSTFIDQIGYDVEARTLVVQMVNSSDVYSYANVPEDIFQRFLQSESKGRYYVEHIKGKYTTMRD